MTSTEQFPLEIKAAYPGWWSKGHHDASRFLAAARLRGCPAYSTRSVEYDYWRYVHGDVVPCTSGKRGCFPVTYIEREGEA